MKAIINYNKVINVSYGVSSSRNVKPHILNSGDQHLDIFRGSHTSIKEHTSHMYLHARIQEFSSGGGPNSTDRKTP